MIHYLLDTCIIRNLTRSQPSASLIAWWSKQDDESLFISTLTIAEIWRGILEMPTGKKRQKLEQWFAGSKGPQNLFAGRVLLFDEKAALAWGEIMAKGKNSGKPGSATDMMIASIAAANGCIVVTDNEKHFTGIKIINPLNKQ
jgi:predicted nucleic acid-binding protein